MHRGYPMKSRSFACLFLISISSPLLLLLSFCTVPVVSAQCLSDQQSLLLHLKNSLVFNHSFSTKLVQWHENTSCCSWEGVTCSDEGRVIGLDLSSESIFGGLDKSSSLFNLHHLQNLSLAYNDFNYTRIPSQLGQLTNLSHLNLSHAHFAGQIPINLSNLRRLVTLDLSNFRLKLENPNLEMLVQNFTELIELHLDRVIISEQGDDWCGALSSSLPNLRVLSLSDCNLSGPLNPSLLKLQSLSSIRLDLNNLSAAVPEFFANFTNLTSLSLFGCELFGTFPEKIFQLPALEVLHLSDNQRLSGSLPDFPQNGKLRILLLRYTNFSGTLPHSIGNLTQLRYLDVSYNNLTGPIPSFNKAKNLRNLVGLDLSKNSLNGSIPVSLFSLLSLEFLDLSNNQFSGELNQFPNISSNVLEYLDLSNNNLEGAIPVFNLRGLVHLSLASNNFNGSFKLNMIDQLKNLSRLDLSNNQFSGELKQFHNISSNVLEYLDLSNNNLEGAIPVFNLRGLVHLSLASNNFNGSFKLNMIDQLKNLSTLDLSYNSLSNEYDRVTDSPSPSFPNIRELYLASNKLKVFPDFLRTQSMLEFLDLSNNEISGEIPNWTWKMSSLRELNLSFNNFMTLEEGSLLNVSSLSILDIRSNRLQGKLPNLPPLAEYLDFSRNNFSSIIRSDVGDFLSSVSFFSLSSNKFEGSIPVSICNATYLYVLDLSNNSFNGMIPECLVAMSSTLGVLNLGRNNLHGMVPDKFPNNCGLQSLDLNRNQLAGHIPKSLENCRSLEFFNIGNNHIEDIFPCHLKNASILQVLVLRSNNFSGSIGCPGHNSIWPMLQIFDVALNNFTGELPIKCFLAWKAMLKSEGEVKLALDHLQFNYLGNYSDIATKYQDVVMVTVKGVSREFIKILTIFTLIDVSCNNFEGPIPEGFGAMSSLYVLNLSHNALLGQIPKSLANLKQLESLDLSSNKLTGEIPKQLAANLSFLSVLNLSFNQLVGQIPFMKQFATFSESSYVGNKGLCGSPLEKLCNAGGGIAPPTPPDSNSKKLSGRKFPSVELGFIFGLGIVIVPLMYLKRWRLWYFQQVDNILYKMFPKLYMIRKAHPRRITCRNRRPRPQ